MSFREGKEQERELLMENENSETQRNEELSLVLIGNTGAGKSASGNTILGRRHFLSKMSVSSVTKLCQHGIAELTENQDSQEDGTERRKRKILVVDVPGFGDTSLSREQILDEVTKCVAVTAPGPHAFLLVVPLGRYTDSENQALCQLAGIFGENAVRHHTVVLFTRGDELEGLEIETFLRDSRNPLLNSLIERCGGRYHVFNNKETGDTLQVEELLMKVDNMVKHTAEGFYTNEMFKEAEAIVKEEQERMRERGEADGQSPSEEKFSGKSTSSPLTNRCRNQSRGKHAGGSWEQSLTCWIKAALSPAVLKRIKIMVAAALTGLVVGATLGAAVPLVAAAGASLTGTTLTGITGSAVALGAAAGGCSGGCVGITAGTEAASAGEAAFNTLQRVSAIGAAAVGLGGAAGLTLGAQAVICAGGVANVASPAAPIAASVTNVGSVVAGVTAVSGLTVKVVKEKKRRGKEKSSSSEKTSYEFNLKK